MVSKAVVAVDVLAVDESEKSRRGQGVSTSEVRSEHEIQSQRMRKARGRYTAQDNRPQTRSEYSQGGNAGARRRLERHGDQSEQENETARARSIEPDGSKMRKHEKNDRCKGKEEKSAATSIKSSHSFPPSKPSDLCCRLQCKVKTTEISLCFV